MYDELKIHKSILYANIYFKTYILMCMKKGNIYMTFNIMYQKSSEKRKL